VQEAQTPGALRLFLSDAGILYGSHVTSMRKTSPWSFYTTAWSLREFRIYIVALWIWSFVYTRWNILSKLQLVFQLVERINLVVSLPIMLIKNREVANEDFAYTMCCEQPILRFSEHTFQCRATTTCRAWNDLLMVFGQYSNFWINRWSMIDRSIIRWSWCRHACPYVFGVDADPFVNQFDPKWPRSLISI
jgi:hypothetical protein